MPFQFLYTGFECEADKCWKDYTIAPSHGGIEDPIKQKEWIREKWRRLEEDAPTRPLVGFVRRATLSDNPANNKRPPLFDGRGRDFYVELDKIEQRGLIGVSEPSGPFVVFGLNAFQRVRQCAIEEAALNSCGERPGVWGIFGMQAGYPPRLRFVDPLAALMGGGNTDDAATVMMRFLGIAPMNLGNAENQMLFLYKLVDHFALTRPSHYIQPTSTEDYVFKPDYAAST